MKRNGFSATDKTLGGQARTSRGRSASTPGALLESPKRRDKIEGAAQLGDRAYAEVAPILADVMGISQQELDAKVRSVNGQRQPIVLRPLHEIIAEHRETRWLLHRILEAEVLAVLAGPRSTFKSFIALHWSMLAARAGHPVVFLSGEGAGLDRRGAAWMKHHGHSFQEKTPRFHALERALNLNMAIDLADLVLAIELLPERPSLIVVDTFSKFSAGIDENDNSQIAAYLANLSISLRDEFRASVLLIAHSGHGDAKRPRGASTLMSNPDAEFIVNRPDMLRKEISVSRDRFKDSPSLAPLGYLAEIIDLGRLDSYGDAVTSLALTPTDAPSKPARAAEPRGKAQRDLLTHLRSIRHVGPGVWTLTDMRKMARDLGQSKTTAYSVVDWLATSGYLQPTIGGSRLSDDAG